MSTPSHLMEVVIKYSYPFDLSAVGFNIPICNSSPSKKMFVGLGDSEVVPARLLVFVSVTAFLYSIASLILYIFFDDFYRKNTKTVVVDFVISVILTMLWLMSSSIWAQGVSRIKFYSNPSESGLLNRSVTECKAGLCDIVNLGNFVALNVSVMFGFLNFVMWTANVWCVYKETPWYKVRSKPASQSGLLSDTDPQYV